MQTNLEHKPLIARVLGDGYLQLRFWRLAYEEDAEGHCKATVTLSEQNKAVDVQGGGVGMIDAIFSGLLGRYGREYASLNTLTLAGFNVAVALDTKKAQSGVDAECTVSIDVKNSEGRTFTFVDSSRSVMSSTARAVLAMAEYFVNSERAFILLDKARRDAMERNREDLVTRYTAEMAELVESTSYTAVIEAIRKRL